MQAVEPLFTAPLFAPLHAELMALLRSLDADAWQQPTAARLWTVKDIAAHLLDGDVRRLSFQRDGHPPPPPEAPVESYHGLVDFLNRLNADWVRAFQRASPEVLIALLAVTGPPLCRLFERLDPFAPALFGVAWAGQETSPAWFDLAREYTEKWHHQQQIRDAVGAPGLTSRRWLHPVLDTFVRGLPHAYRGVDTPAGTHVTLHLSGEAGDTWTLVREEAAWRLFTGSKDAAAAVVHMDQDTAWRLFTRGLPRAQAAGRIHTEGEAALAVPVLDFLAVMA